MPLSRQRFFAAVAGLLMGRLEPDLAEEMARAGLTIPDDLPPADGIRLFEPQHSTTYDADLWLAVACAREMRSTVTALRVEPRAGDDRDPRERISTELEERVLADRRLALSILARVLEHTPDASAYLHFGRLHAELRHYDEADRALATAASSTNPRIQYLAELFRGDVREQIHDQDGAIECYRRAIRVYPSAQTARVALAAVLAAGGEHAAARDAVLPATRAPWAATTDADPWWEYPFGTWRAATEILDAALHQAGPR